MQTNYLFCWELRRKHFALHHTTARKYTLPSVLGRHGGFIAKIQWMLAVSIALAGSIRTCPATEFQNPILLESPNAQPDGWFGAEGVSWVPDVNGDGIVDLIVPALNESPPGSPQGAGRVYVFDGATRAVLRELKSPGEVAGSEFGTKIAGISDLNGNGSGDVIVATYRAESRVYVLDGASGETIHSIPTRARSLSAVPDTNGDGLSEILIGFDGSATLYDGSTGLAMDAQFIFPIRKSNLYGWAVSGVEDVNNDGAGDAVVGDWRYSGSQGQALIYNGATGRHLHYLLPPEGSSGGFGRSVAGLGDLNGDGRAEVVVGASSENGRAYVFDGASGDLLHTLRAPAEDAADAQFGWVVKSVPDVTGDGLTDVVVRGSPASTPTSNAYVFDGASGLHVATLPGNADFGGGDSMSGVPDLNGDGLGEILVANWRATSAAGQGNAGHVLLYLSTVSAELPALEAVGMEDQAFTLVIQASAESTTTIEATSDYENWEPVAEIPAGGSPVELKDTEAPNYSRRFYRSVVK